MASKRSAKASKAYTAGKETRAWVGEQLRTAGGGLKWLGKACWDSTKTAAGASAAFTRGVVGK